MAESSIGGLSCFVRRRVDIMKPRPGAMASICMVVVSQCLHLEADVGDFGKQSTILDLIRFRTRRHAVYPNLEDESGVWLIPFVVTKNKKPPSKKNEPSEPRLHERGTTSPGNKARLPTKISIRPLYV